MAKPKRKQLNITLSEKTDYGYNNKNIPGLTNLDMMEEAFDKLTVVIDKLSPANPPYLSDSNVAFSLTGNTATYPSPNSFKTGYISGTGTLVTNITGLPTPIFATPANASYYFFNGYAGSLKLQSGAGYLDLTPDDDTGLTFTSGGYTVTILDDIDYYLGQQGKEDFWYAIRVQVQRSTSISPGTGMYSFTLEHYRDAGAVGVVSGSKSSPTYRVESVNVPDLTNFISTGVTYSSGKKVSGVPVLSPSDSFTFAFDMTNVAKQFYPLNPISFSSTNSDLSAPTWNWPSTPAVNSSQSSMVITASPVSGRFRDRNGNISASGGALSATLVATDVLGLTDTISLSNSDANKLRIDTISSESTRRLRGGTTIYSTQLTTAYDTNEVIVGNSIAPYNKELQLKGGIYVYPTENYSGYLPSNSINYSGQTGMRWITFKIGTVTNVKQVQISTPGLTQELSSGSFGVYVRVGNANTNTWETGWFDASTAYTGTAGQQSAINTDTDGAAALDTINNASHSATNRLVTLVTSGDTGSQKDVFIRIKWDDSNSTYKLTGVPSIIGTNGFGSYTNYTG